MWLFNGKPFEGDITKLFGFVYLITNTVTGKMYVGRKYFWSMRKPKGKTRRAKCESDWQKYYSSSAIIKAEVKEHGKDIFKREILSLHELQRDVNYCEIREMWRRDVLETVDSSGERLYYNDNIQGKFYPGLYKDWKSRSIMSEDHSQKLD